MTVRRLFLAAPPEGTPPQLAEGEAHHALHVLRLGPGDAVLGLDGQGLAWPLVVRSVERRSLTLERTGAPERAPRPRPEVEVAVSLPRGPRAEDMLDRLTQLGVTSLRPTVFERTQAFARELGGSRRERLERRAREACKQSGRLWLPVLHDPIALENLWDAEGPTALLDPEAGPRLVDWLAELRAPASVRILIGPEGGATPAERAAADEHGVARVGLAGPVLRVETAAELACGLALQLVR